MKIGESWAYRARSQDELVAVAVKSIGTKKPARLLVHFMDPKFEGREEWVPPVRLKAPWSQVGEFIARERRWHQVTATAPDNDTPQEYATSIVFDTLIDEALATRDYRITGVAKIQDLPALATWLDLPEDQLRANPLAFVEAGALVVPWATTELIARTAASRDPEPILRGIQQDQNALAHKMVHGTTYPGRRGNPTVHIPAETYVQSRDDSWHGPTWDLLRQWCGTGATDRHDELTALRREVARIGKLAERAVGALRNAGQKRAADEIERELGMPLDLAREA